MSVLLALGGWYVHRREFFRVQNALKRSDAVKKLGITIVEPDLNVDEQEDRIHLNLRAYRRATRENRPLEHHPRARMIIDMETLQMTIGEISSRLLDLLRQESYFEFLPFPNDTFTSDTIDFAIRKTQQKFMIDVSEPTCGIPNLELVLFRDNAPLRSEITTIWEATRKRRAYLADVMTEVINLNSGDLNPDSSVRMIDVADACNLHVTTISRILDNKICRLDDRTFPCRSYIYGLRSNEN